MTKHRQEGRPALDLIDEAIHLLRRAPLSAFAAYCVGSFPFALGLLYFWADMSKGAFAFEHVEEGALTIALLFVWMKCWHVVFASRLRALVAAEPPVRWSLARIGRMTAMQTILQPSALFARPVAMLITLPYGWVYAFYQNVVVLGDGRTGNPREVFSEAAKQAKLWPRQNHLALSVLTGFGIFVWANVAFAIVGVPWMLKTFFGIETMFTKSSYSLFNSTFFVATCVCTFLCMNPIYHALYVLRCFHGGSLRSGDDLRIELRSFIRAAAMVIAAMMIAGSFANAAEPAPGPSPVAAVAPAELNDAIEQVLSRREYTWRMPREKPPLSTKGVVSRFLDGVIKTVKGWMKPVKRWIRKIADWIEDWMRRRAKPDDDRKPFAAALMKSLRITLYVLTGGVVCVLGFLLWKRFRQRDRNVAVYAEAVPAVPDLSAEDVVADQLPEDGWLKLAREMMERGELRLALRAFYLAGLAHLGTRELIAIAKHKSNHDYERELRRRARTRDDLLGAFDQNVAAFERAWYGMHDVSVETLGAFSDNLEKIRAC